MSREEFVKKYYRDAVEATKGTGVFPETLLAQAIVESQGKNAAGNYEPGLSLNARKANNYFGIKCYPKWKGRTIILPTPNDAKKNSCFVVYDSVLDSFRGYVRFLQVNPRYNKALTAPNYQEQIIRLATAGYAEADRERYINTLTNVATNLRKWITNANQAINTATNNNRVLFPILFAGAIITAVIISKSLKK